MTKSATFPAAIRLNSRLPMPTPAEARVRVESRKAYMRAYHKVRNAKLRELAALAQAANTSDNP